MEYDYHPLFIIRMVKYSGKLHIFNSGNIGAVVARACTGESSETGLVC